MSYGFIAYNDNNDVLVSSDTRNLHFLGKYTTPTSTITSFDTHGGIRHWKYTVNASVTPVVFMYMPTTDYYGVVRTTQNGTTQYDIEVIRSGTSSTTPDLYVFADPRASTATDQYGMIVYQDDGTAAFDSRLSPLAITGGATVTHPNNPKGTISSSLNCKNCGSSDSAAGSVFAPDQYNTYTVTGQPDKPMFFFASLAQSEREVTHYCREEECDGFDAYGNCVGAYRVYEWHSYYWCFYRGGISWDNDQTLKAGWIANQYGCRWTYSKDSAFIGIGTGGSSGSGGTWPYSNQTLNLQNNAVIIGDASRYD